MSSEIYATIADYEAWTFVTDLERDDDGYLLPDNLSRGLGSASRLFDNLPTVQARYVLSQIAADVTGLTDPEDIRAARSFDENSLRDALRDAVCAQVEYWVEVAGGSEVDLSQDILRPVWGGWTKVGDVTLPPYQVVAPRAIQVLQDTGWWSPNPNRVLWRTRGWLYYA